MEIPPLYRCWGLDGRPPLWLGGVVDLNNVADLAPTLWNAVNFASGLPSKLEKCRFTV